MDFYDIIVIIPLELEMGEFLGTFEVESNETTGRHITYRLKTINDIRILAVMQESMGRDEAMQACHAAFQNRSCSLLMSLGIAGGLSKDLKLGDVCYSGPILDIYNNAVASDLDSGLSLELVPEYYSTNRCICSPLGYVRVMPELRALYDDWQAQQDRFVRALVDKPVPGRKGEKETIGRPASLPGPIVCGQVSRSENYNARLKALNRKVAAVDTESGAVFSFAQSRGIEALTVRGVSDYADRSKGDLEGISKEAVRAIAAKNAATFLLMQLSNPYFLNALRELRSRHQPELPLSESPVPTSSLPSTMEILSSDIDKKLRVLSPQYRSKPKGYVLPVPRIRKISYATPTSKAKPDDPLEIRDAILLSSRSLIRIPRTYPDKGLAWIVANDLIGQERDGRQIVPIVIDGKKIRPPRGTLQGLSLVDLDVLRAEESKLVFIIDEVPLDSATGLDLLVEQVQTHPDAIFIFLATDDEKLLSRSEFARRAAAETYALCDISFLEMATWVQSQFAIPGSDAEVIALRLRNLFKRFRLPAHPTFFAGIPEEIFNAILRANRRAELIQLAVDGFLSFIVANDPQSVRLSRTTRARFLRLVAFEAKVQKRYFTKDEVIAFTNEFASQYDLPIDSKAFVEAFVQHGIINFRNNRAEISLPFVESYLLAVELSERVDDAKAYFDIGDPDFDILTFDLFAEISAHSAVVDAVRNGLAQSVTDLAGTDASAALMSGQINPKLLRNEQRVTALENRIRYATEAVRRGSSDKQEKQRLLDMVDHAHERMAEEAERGDAEAEEQETDLDRHIRTWFIAAVLLGQGAERLTVGVKNEIIANILTVSSQIMARWVLLNSEVDFDSLTSRLIADPEMRKFMESDARGMKESDFDKLISAFVDLFEMAVMIDPIRKVFFHLSEQARHVALVPAIKRPKGLDALTELLRASWLADVDIEAGKKPLEKAVAALPHAAFLRFAVTTHFFTRVFWNVPDKKTRLALLDLCNELLKPLNKAIPKGELKRLVESSEDNDQSDIDD